MSSDEAWNVSQRTSAGYIIIAGCGPAVGGLVLSVVLLVGVGPSAPSGVASTIALSTAAWAAGWVIAGGVAGQRAARDITGPR
jgi:CBS domain containing-hemolysin-like protein